MVAGAGVVAVVGGKVDAGEIVVTLEATLDDGSVAIATVDEGGASSVLRLQMVKAATPA